MLTGDIVKDVKKYLGLFPYDDIMNTAKGDIFFYTDLCSEYGECAVKDMIAELESEGFSLC